MAQLKLLISVIFSLVFFIAASHDAAPSPGNELKPTQTVCAAYRFHLPSGFIASSHDDAPSPGDERKLTQTICAAYRSPMPWGAQHIGSPRRGAQKTYSPSGITKVVFLGTGTPNPDPQHSGNSVAVVVNDTPYIIDFGPGLIRKAAALSPRYGGKIKGLEIENIKRAFLTHLHSDHTTGYPDLIFTPWVEGRDEPLEVYGPEGIKAMTQHILEAYKEDIRVRLYGLEPANNRGWRVNAHEIKEGVVYKDENVTVEAFLVEHGSWPEAYGFKFTTPDRTIAVSGDTRLSKNLVEKCKDVDILIHEVYSHEKLKERTPFWQKYHPQFHTSTYELAEIARQVKPGLLILYHQLYWGISDDELVKEITDHYKGKVVSAKDLDVY